MITKPTTTKYLEIKELRKELYLQRIKYKNRIVQLNAEIAAQAAKIKHLEAYIDQAEKGLDEEDKFNKEGE